MRTQLKITVLFLSLLLMACGKEQDTNASQSASPGSGNQYAGKQDDGEQSTDYSGRSMRVLDIAESSYDGGNALTVTLSIPLDATESQRDFFLLTEIGKGTVTASPVISKNGTKVYFPAIEPDTKYQLTVHKGLMGIQGEPLSLAVEQTITTRNIGANYRFLSEGAFLSLKQYKGLPIEVVNTPEVNVDFFKVDDAHVSEFVTRNHSFRDKTYRYDTSYYLKDSSLIHSARYQFDAPKNKRREFNIPVRTISELSQPGVYAAVMSLPGDFQKPVRMTYFTITDIGMHVRFYPKKAEVLLTSIEDQSPLAGVEIELFDEKGSSLYQTKSSPDGFANITTDLTKGRLLIARDASSFSMVKIQEPALDLSDHNLAMRPFSAQELFLYSPRNLYRPGEIAKISGLLRNFDGYTVAAPTLKAVLRRPDGSSAKHYTWQSDTAGFYQLNITIPSDAATGLWTLDVSNVADKPVTYQFKVEDFLPERMKLTFNDNTSPLPKLNTQPYDINILGEYLYGAPASQNRFEPRIFYRPKREAFAHLKGFEFGDQDEKNLKGEIELKDMRLDDSGRGNLRIDAKWKGLKSPIEARLVGSLFESGGRPVTRVHSTILLPDNRLLGIRPIFEDNPAENSRTGIEIISVDSTGKLNQLTDVEVTLIREERSYFWEYSDYDGWHYEWRDKEYPVLSTTLTTKESGAVKFEFPVEYGNYRIEVKHPQSKGFSSLRFFAGTDWYNNWRESQSGSNAARPDMVSLALDKASYLPGDIAELSLVPPKAGESIVLVESDQLLWSKRLSVPQDGTVVKIPIDEQWTRHDIHISVVHLQYGSKQKSITPSRAIGLIHLPLDREPRRLKLDINVDDKIYPNQSYTANIKVTGQSQKAWVTLAMVDVGVLSLTNFKTPDPFTYFFEPRRFEVDARDMYQKLIALSDSPFAKKRFGGDATLSRGGKKARSDVQILSLFSGLVEVNEGGSADIEFEIPDFNGKVRLMAVAFSDDKFAAVDTEMTIAAPVVTQLSMPRFMANGDESSLALDLHNLTDATQNLKVQIQASAPLDLNEIRELTLEPDAKTTLTYSVTADSMIQTSNIKLQVNGLEDYPINRSWSLAVRPAYPALTKRRSAALKQGEHFGFSLNDSDDIIPETFAGILSVGNSIDLNIQDHMDNLLRYPYGCLEQTTSTTYPWLYATGQSQLTQGLPSDLLDKRSDAISKGLNKIGHKAKRNGGFGLWTNSDDEQHWLTAYVGDFLTDARQEGISVDNGLYNNVMKRLQDYTKGKNSHYYNRWSESNGHYDFAYRAYAAYVLSRHQKAHLSSLRSLAKQSAKAESPLPLVHLGLAMINQGDKKGGQALIAQSKSTNRPSKYLGDYGSVLRDNALLVRLLIENSVDIGYASEIAYDLAGSLRSARYLSTQERGALLLAGLALETLETAQWQAELSLDSLVSTLKFAGTSVTKLNASVLGSGMDISHDMADPLFVNLTYQGVPKVKPEPVSQGLKIIREYYDLKGNKINPDSLYVGDLMLVSLSVLVNQQHPDLLVIDLLPAGLEIENQNLEHSIKLDEFKVGKYTVGEWVRGTKVVHQEYRDDRYIAAIDLTHNKAAKSFYLVRAVTPGKYRVPAPLVEDMYRPQFNAVGETADWLTITANKSITDK